MPESFKLRVFVPDKRFFDDDAQEILFATPAGRIGVMAGHMPMVASVSAGTLDILRGDDWKTAAVSQGFAEIAGDTVTLFLDTAEWADEIDTVRAREALERAELRLKSELSRMQYIQTRTAIARALARLKAAAQIEAQ
jgi:F-type H+-transporting ATPase subunit epsilon